MPRMRLKRRCLEAGQMEGVIGVSWFVTGKRPLLFFLPENDCLKKKRP